MEIENDYETAEEEQDAHTATYANLARAAVFRLMAELPEDDPWAEKVFDALNEAHDKLSDLAHEEARLRPGMLEVGRAYGAAFQAKHQAAWAEFAALSNSQEKNTP